MRTLFASLVLVCLLSALLFAQRKQLPDQKPLAFTHVTVIDTTGAPPKPDMTVVIAGDRIVALETSAKLVPPADAQVIDATGKFLIPGLWDMHFHLDDPEMWPTPRRPATLPLINLGVMPGVSWHADACI